MAAGEKEIIYHSNGEATTATTDHHSSDYSSAVPTFVPYETLREQNIIAGLMKTKLWLRKNTPTWMHGLWRQVWPCLPASTPPPQNTTAACRRRRRPHPLSSPPSNHPS